MKWLLFICIYITGINVHGQSISESKLLDFYGDAMMNSYQEENRAYAFEQFLPLFKKMIADKELNDSLLVGITGIHMVTPPDKSFRLFSWELEIGEHPTYYAFLQKQNGEVYEFVQNNEDLGVDFSYYIHGTDDWYGAIYYKIREEKSKKNKQYLITAFKKIDKYKKAKIVEVLTFSEDGTPLLGKEIFHKPVKDSRDEVFSKLLLIYDAKAYVEFNYDSDTKRIVYDHLVSQRSKIPEQGYSNYPDGTYEGYDNKKGVYHYLEMSMKK